MNKLLNNSDSSKLSNIQSCDPILADIIKDCYVTLEQREQDGLTNFFESGLKQSIEDILSNGLEVRERQINAFFDNFRKLLDRKSDNSWIQSEQKMFGLIEGLMYVELFGEESEMSVKIGAYAQKIMKLNYAEKLPMFELNGIKKNIFNYFAFVLESISESISEATISKKTIDAYFELNENVMLIVTDEYFKIRSLNNISEQLFESSISELKGEHLFVQLPELGIINSHNIDPHRINREPILIRLPKTGLKTAHFSFIRCENADEITEFLFVIDFNTIDSTMEVAHHNNYGITNNLIHGVHSLRKQNLNDVAIDQTTTVLQNLYYLRENSKSAISAKDNSNFVESEIINFDQLFNHIHQEIKYLPLLDKVCMSFDNRLNRVISCKYQSLFSIIKNLVMNSILFQDTLKPLTTITITIQSNQDGIEIIVTDNGAGIEKHHLEFIFNKGFKVNPKSESMGFGLYYTKQLVYEMGGHISVDSEYFEFTTFKVQLPLLNRF